VTYDENKTRSFGHEEYLEVPLNKSPRRSRNGAIGIFQDISQKRIDF